MSIWHITGGSPLRGQIRVQGSKNAVLPVIAASLLCGADTELLNCPNLSDVDAAMDILRYLGCTAARCGDALCIDTTAPARCDIPRELMHRMRSSVIFLGPLLARFGEAEVSLPGGCELGPRPIDLHLHALRLLGAEIEEGEDSIVCRLQHLRGAEISLALPSVGATENARSPPARRRGRPSSITPPASRRSKRCKAIFARSARTYPAQARPSSGSPAFPRALTRDFASRPTGSPRQHISAARRAPAGRSSLPPPRPDRSVPVLDALRAMAAP